METGMIRWWVVVLLVVMMTMMITNDNRQTGRDERKHTHTQFIHARTCTRIHIQTHTQTQTHTHTHTLTHIHTRTHARLHTEHTRGSRQIGKKGRDGRET